MGGRLAVIGLAVILGVVAFVVLAAPGEDPSPAEADPRPAVARTPSPTPGSRGAASDPAPRSLGKPGPERPGPAVKKVDRARADALRERILSALAEAAGGKPENPGFDLAAGAHPRPTDEVPPLDPKYIQDRVREVVPLVKECYDLARAESPDDPLDGRVVMEIVVAGDPDLGGVIEESRVIDDVSDLRNDTLDECMVETLYTVEMDAPTDGGRVTIHYPFVFRSGD